LPVTKECGSDPWVTPARKLKLNRYFNQIGVRSFILPGAPSTQKTANTRAGTSAGRNLLFANGFLAESALGLSPHGFERGAKRSCHIRSAEDGRNV
jgi:hypothetical protein